MMSSRDVIEGAVYGMAYGDAFGYPVEFLRYREIVTAKPKEPRILEISDDTQMSIYNVYALRDLVNCGLVGQEPIESAQHAEIRRIFAEHHLHFHHDKDNTRAPGITVTRALVEYEVSARETGQEGAGNNSKGCGTVMRSPWLGLTMLPRNTISTLSILQSQTTHGHPISWLAAAVGALVTHDLAHGRFDRGVSAQLIEMALAAVDKVEDVYQSWIPKQEFEDQRAQLRWVMTTWDRFVDFDGDPTEMYGRGATADEALVVALAVASRFLCDPLEGIRRLVYTGGDSDSIAAIGGAFLGAANGYSSLGVDVKSRLEPRYQAELSAVCDILAQS